MTSKIKAKVLDTYMCCREPYKLKEVEGTSYTYNDCNFIIVKQPHNYELYELYTGLFVMSDKTIKALKEKLTKTVETSPSAKSTLDNIKSIPTAEERIKKQERFYSLDDEFTKITNIILPLRFGVDVIALSKQLGIMELDISLQDCIEKKYGKRASEVLEEMVKLGCVD